MAFEQEHGVVWACERLQAGAEIDDMIHLVAAVSLGAEAFLTFDAAIRKRTLADPLLRIDLLA